MGNFMYFALDFGGTNFRIGWTNFLKDFNVITNTRKIKNSKNYKRDSNRIIKIMKSVSPRANGIAIALPGHFNHKKMVLDHANNLKTWVNKPFFKLLTSEFNCGLVVDKDSSLAAIGEGLNNSLNKKEFLYITWGTGIGGCIVTTKAGYLPQVKTLSWKNTFRKIENLCSGGHAVANFGIELTHLNDTQWRIIIKHFVTEVEKICDHLKSRSVILGGGIAAKRGDIVLIVQKELNKNKIKLVSSQLNDFSAIYGGFALLRSKINEPGRSIDFNQSL